MRQVSFSGNIHQSGRKLFRQGKKKMSPLAVSPVSLSSLGTGRTGRLHEARLDDQSVNLLRALGLAPTDAFRLCKAGDPCILQVGGTRIGVSRAVASEIYVIPDRAPV